MGAFRPRLLIAALLLAFVTVGALAVRTVYAERSHRRIAARTLRDYAEFAAWQYASHVRAAVDHAVHHALWPATSPAREAGARLPGPEVLAGPGALRCDFGPDRCALARTAAYRFRYDPARGTLDFHGAAPPERERAWLGSALRGVRCGDDTGGAGSSARHAPPAGGTLLAGRRDGELAAVACAPGRAGTRPALYGVHVEAAALATVLAPVAGREPLLPPTLTRGLPADSLLAVAVILPWGRAAYRSRAPAAAAAVAYDTLGARFGGLRVSVGIRPERAAGIVIGGVPRSTLPLLLGLLLASAFLVAAALAQLRRETEVVHLRADFVANVSHELRTPLAQIQMFLDTLRMERARSPEERARFLEIAAREVRRLAQLVENVLQFARLERSAEHLRPEATDVSAELRDALAAFEPLARGRHAALVLEGTDQPVRALADRAALRQIILNLLDNAVKHGPKGQTIILGVERREHRVRLRVDDQGPGVSPADRERIFHPFVRADPGGRLGTSGTGIGLAVVRELAALQRGTVWVEDAPGGGARFVVELPAAREGAAVQARAGA